MQRRTFAVADGRRRFGFWDFKLTEAAAAAERSRNTVEQIGLPMRFFTNKWLIGELTDAAFDAVPVRYQAHLATLRLPPDVFTLTQVDIHDGLILDMQHEPLTARLTLCIRCGDLQRGYHDLRIEYSGAALDDTSLSVLRDAKRIPKDEFLYDEISRVGDCFEHRFILSSHNEVCVTFAAVAVGSHPVDSRATL